MHLDISSQLRLSLLGPPQIQFGTQKLVIQRRKAQALFYYMAVTGEWHHRASLATLFWPESDQPRAQGSLRRNLSELNGILGNDWLEIQQELVRLAPTYNHWVDVREFRRLLAAYQRSVTHEDSVPARNTELLTVAVALYQADFMSGFSLPDAPAFDEWQTFQTEELRMAYGVALEQLSEAYLAQDKPDEAILYVRRRLALDPLHEPAHQQLMRLYASMGQQAAALQQYQICVEALRAELDVPPSEKTTDLYRRIRQGEFAASADSERLESTTARAPTVRNLPAPTTPLIGRSGEIAELVPLCRDPARRLIAILGPGGIGKTHLALELASQLTDELTHGVYFVRLAQLSDSANIVPAIADALDFQFQADGRTAKQQLFAYLRPRHLLLVLDNFEHLMTGIPFIQELLHSCPQTRLLVTSRERLNLTAETIYTLGSLSLPNLERHEQTQDYGAVQLFVETARRILPTQALDDDDMLHVVRICRMVGGMPLGIILAAAWMRALSPSAIAAELAGGFELLEGEMRDLPPRQRSMRLVLTYSWQRLTPDEQKVFMRLAVFRGGFTLEAARTIAGATLPLLAHFVDKSFVHRTGSDRCDVHELVRQFALRQLEAARLVAEVEATHGVYFLTLLHDCELRMAGAQQLDTIRQIENDFENIRAAWLWAVSSNQATWIDKALGGLFRWFWLRRARQQEALELLRLARQAWAPEPGHLPNSLWGRLLARSVEQQGPWFFEPARALERAKHALEIAQAHADSAEEVFCKWVLAHSIVSLYRQERPVQEMQWSIALYKDCVAVYRTDPDPFWLPHALELMGHGMRRWDIHDRALVLLTESLELRRSQGDRFGMARSLREIAWVHFKEGLESETFAAAQAAYLIQCELGDQLGIADSRFFLALSLLCRGDWQRAKELSAHVRVFAATMNNVLYQTWGAKAYTVASCMEENMRQLQATSCSFPNQFNQFSTVIMHLIWGIGEVSGSYLRLLRQLVDLATTDEERAVCLPFFANLMMHIGRAERAVNLLALAHRYPVISAGWIGLYPPIVALQESLRDALPPSVFEQAWAAGEQLALLPTISSLAADASGDHP